MNWQTPNVRVQDGPAILAFAEGLQRIRGTAFQPPDEVDGLAWVEEHCSFSRETTGHDDDVELYGYQRGIIKVMTDGLHDKVVVPKSTRSGITQCASFAAAFFIAHVRTQVVFVQPTEAKAKDWEKSYMEPMLRDIFPLAAVKRYPRKGEVQDTWSLKFFTNGSVFRCYSAESADNFTSYTGQVQIGDELDRDGWASGGVKSQGTKQKLFEERSRTFPRRKTIYMSSPRRKTNSRIWGEWEKSDKRRYNVPCPMCGGMQYLKLGSDKTRYGLKWEIDDNGHVTSVAYQCEHCHDLIPEEKKRWMDSQGEWIPTAVPERPGIAGFHVNMLMSLFSGAGWATIAQEWLAAQANPEDLETAVNNILGEPWDEIEGVAIEPEGLALRAVPLPAEVPDWVGLLTCGMDCQSGSEDQDRLDAKPPRVEAQVIGWGPEGRFIPIAYKVFDDHYPFSLESEAELDAFRRRPWAKRDGTHLIVQATAIDLGGTNGSTVSFADEVRAYANGRARRKENVWAVKGNNTRLAKAESRDRPIWPRKASRKPRSGQWFQIETQQAKHRMDRMMKMTVAGGGHLFTIPRSLVEMPGYLDGLTAESVKPFRGARVWRPKGANTGEPWDTLIYAFAARLGLQASSAKWADLNLAFAGAGVVASSAGYHGEDRSYNATHRGEDLTGKPKGLAEKMVDAVREAVAEVRDAKLAPPPPPPKVRRPRIMRVSRWG